MNTTWCQSFDGDKTRLFNSEQQIERFSKDFVVTEIVEPKWMNNIFFKNESFTFQERIKEQRLKRLVSLNAICYIDAMKGFYSNLSVKENGYLEYAVLRKKL